MPSSQKNVSDLHRLLEELVLLKGHDRWTPKLLGTHFGVSEKTARRDIKKLVANGFNVRFDRKRGGYRLASDTFLPPVQLSLDEALALIVICEDVAGRGQVGLLGAAVSALSKVEAQLPPALKDRLNSIIDHVAVRLAPSGCVDGESEVFEQIRQTIVTQTVLQCNYQSPSRREKAASFGFEPYSLWFGVRAWYAIGKHQRRGEVVALKLRRIVQVTRTNETFVRPPGFTVDTYLGNAWQMIPGGRDYEVELRFEAGFGETVTDTKWHRTQEVIRHEDGSLTMRFTVSGLREIVWWVLSMGRHCRVIKPKELSRLVRLEAAATLKVHAEKPTRSLTK